MLLETLRRTIRRNGQRLDRLTVRADPLTRFADPTAVMVVAGYSPDSWQAEFLRATDKQSLLMAARQSGKSLTVAAKALHRAITRPVSTIVAIAARQDQARELLRKVANLNNAIGRPVRLLRESTGCLEWVNGSRVIVVAATEGSVHGYSANMLILDEAARIPDPIFHSAAPQISASKGDLIALSTAYAASGWWHREWTEGANYRRWTINADQCSRHSPEFLANLRKQMGDRWFRMSFFNEFVSDSGGVFDMEMVHAAIDHTLAPLFTEVLP